MGDEITTQVSDSLILMVANSSDVSNDLTKELGTPKNQPGVVSSQNLLL